MSVAEQRAQAAAALLARDRDAEGNQRIRAAQDAAFGASGTHWGAQGSERAEAAEPKAQTTVSDAQGTAQVTELSAQRMSEAEQGAD